MPLEPNQIYVIPAQHPNDNGRGGCSNCLRRKKAGATSHSIDHFLESLARDRGALAHRHNPLRIGYRRHVGTLREIKNEGGITFAQDGSARYDGMPRSAVASGCVDLVLPPAKIAEELGNIARHARLIPAAGRPTVEISKEASDYKKVLRLLQMRTGTDFTSYKSASIERRIARRMVLHKASRLSDYLRHLRDHPGEVDALYQDVLINVTGFFRDSKTFEILKQKVFPKIIKDRAPDEPVRIWVLGCSTGQEAYSLAMTFLEFTAKTGAQIPLQIFGTDLNDTLLEKARAGLYLKSQVQELSTERLRRFFVQEDGGFRVSKALRDLCVFARHDIQTDPPFSRMDLLSCRNVMIYLEPVLQKRLMPIFHYALKQRGFLLLGNSESIGAFTDLFSSEDKTHRLYCRKPTGNRPRVSFQSGRGPAKKLAAPRIHRPLAFGLPGETEAQSEADRVLLAKYAPAGVLINDAMEVLQFRGRTGPYLEPPSGRASHNFLKMLREGLLSPVKSAISRARKDAQTIRVEDVEFRHDNQTRRVNLEVIPLKYPKERWFLVLFEAPLAGGRAGRGANRHTRSRGFPPIWARHCAKIPDCASTWPPCANTCNRSRNNSRLPTKNSSPPTRNPSPATKNCKPSTKNWKRRRRRCNPPTRS